MARTLLIDGKIRARINEVVRYAAEHVITKAQVAEMTLGLRPSVGDRPEHRVEIPVGYRVVFSIEEGSIGYVRHMSVSVDKPNKIPNHHAVEQLAKEFGFVKDFASLKKSLEDLPNGSQSIDVLEIIDPA